KSGLPGPPQGGPGLFLRLSFSSANPSPQHPPRSGGGEETLVGARSPDRAPTATGGLLFRAAGDLRSGSGRGRATEPNQLTSPLRALLASGQGVGGGLPVSAHEAHQKIDLLGAANEQWRARLEAGGGDAEDASGAVGRLAPRLFGEEGDRVGLVHQPQLAAGV